MTSMFIVIEGIDGIGKSTQAKLLADKLRELASTGTIPINHVILTREPTEGIIGGLIRAVLKKDWYVPPDALQLLFASDRAKHVAFLRPYISDNKSITIFDRYYYSSIAYGSLDCNREWLEMVNSNFPVPDILIVLDAPVEVVLERIKSSRHSFELFESDVLEEVRRVYLELAVKDNGYIVDATRCIKCVHKEILGIVLNKLKSR